MIRRALAACLVAVAAGPLLAGCGLPADDSPQAIAPDDVPPDLLDPNPSSSTTVPAGGTEVVIYLLEETANGTRLAEATREVRQAGVPDDRLAALFDGLLRGESDAGLSTQIPADTVLRDVDVQGDVVVIDVSGDLLSSIQGPALAQAFAQIVWTATEPSAGGHSDVRFLVDGTPGTVIDGEGVQQEGPVSRADYSNLSPRR